MPKINLRSIRLGAVGRRLDLGSVLIWCPYPSVELLILGEHQGAAKARNLDPSRASALFEVNIFWTQVPQDDVLGVAILKAREYLLDQN